MPVNPRRIQQFNTILQGIARMGMQGADMLDATLDAAGMLKKNAGRAARAVEPIRDAKQLRLPLETRVDGRFGRVTGPKNSSINRELSQDIGRPEPIRRTPRTEGQMDMGLERGALTRSPGGRVSTDINTPEDAMFRVRGGEMTRAGGGGLVRQESRGIVRSPGGEVTETYSRKVYPEVMGPEAAASSARGARGGFGGETVDVDVMAPRNAMQNIGVDLNRLRRRDVAGGAAGIGLAGGLAAMASMRGDESAGEVSPTSTARPDQMPLTGESPTPNTDLATDLPVTREQQEQIQSTVADEMVADALGQYAPEIAKQMPRSPETYRSADEYKRDRMRSSDERREMAERNTKAAEMLGREAAITDLAKQYISQDPYGAYELSREAMVDPNQSLQTSENVSTETIGSELGDNNANNAAANVRYGTEAAFNPNQANTDLETASMGFKKPVLMTENQAEKFGAGGRGINAAIEEMLLEKAMAKKSVRPYEANTDVDIYSYESDYR